MPIKERKGTGCRYPIYMEMKREDKVWKILKWDYILIFRIMGLDYAFDYIL